MKPGSRLAGNLGNIGGRIDGSEVGGAGSGNDGHRQETLSLQSIDLLAERGGTHPELIVQATRTTICSKS